VLQVAKAGVLRGSSPRGRAFIVVFLFVIHVPIVVFLVVHIPIVVLFSIVMLLMVPCCTK
jgi:hypothetical protein